MLCNPTSTSAPPESQKKKAPQSTPCQYLVWSGLVSREVEKTGHIHRHARRREGMRASTCCHFSLFSSFVAMGRPVAVCSASSCSLFLLVLLVLGCCSALHMQSALTRNNLNFAPAKIRSRPRRRLGRVDGVSEEDTAPGPEGALIDSQAEGNVHMVIDEENSPKPEHLEVRVLCAPSLFMSNPADGFFVYLCRVEVVNTSSSPISLPAATLFLKVSTQDDDVRHIPKVVNQQSDAIVLQPGESFTFTASLPMWGAPQLVLYSSAMGGKTIAKVYASLQFEGIGCEELVAEIPPFDLIIPPYEPKTDIPSSVGTAAPRG
jgi:hypothetical protein